MTEPIKRERLVDDGYCEWAMCWRPDCDLQVVRPGKVQCRGEREEQCPRTVSEWDLFRRQRNGSISGTPSAECEGSRMPRPDVRAEPGVEFQAGNPHGTTSPVEFGQEKRASTSVSAGKAHSKWRTLRNEPSNERFRRRFKVLRYPGATVLFAALGRVGIQLSLRTKRDFAQRG